MEALESLEAAIQHTCKNASTLECEARPIHFKTLRRRLLNVRQDPSHHLRHLCGHRWCKLEEHMAWGTPHENKLDMIYHRKVGCGALAPMQWTESLERRLLNKTWEDGRAKLSPFIVWLLRREKEYTDVSYRELAERYEVTTMTIWNAVNRKTWKDVA